MEYPPLLHALLAQARDTKQTTLNLAQCDLSTLPVALGTCHTVQTLQLAINSLTDLPPWLDQLIGLRHLDLSHTKLRAV
ncbi:MAG TPA: hypothetical protein VGE07_12640, partial [Herpetosiphonaceae bacterium]